MLKAKLLGATAGAEAALAIEDVFSTYLYTGNGSTQTITNGVDLAGEGGLVWLKARSAATDNFLFDTIRGTTKEINSNSTAAEATLANSLTAFNANGFSIGSATGIGVNAATYASWTFRKAPRFFDVVTYTGNGTSNTQIAHNLGVTPGCIMIKQTSGTNNWIVYHRGANGGVNPEQYNLYLNLTNAQEDFILFNDTAPTSTNFTVSNYASVNGSGSTYVAYLFAHDPLGPSGDGSDGLIACGSFTTVSNAATVTLGWEPQFVLVKKANEAESWVLMDNMRDGTFTNSLLADTSGTETTSYSGSARPTATGFTSSRADSTFIYIAIRRGPMREPTVGTEVFAPVLGDATPPAFNTTFPIDLNVYKWRTSAAGSIWSDRLRGAQSLNSSNTNAEFANSLAEFDYMNGFGDSTGFTSDYVGWNFRRAPGFFDVVAYTGNGVSGRTVSHNLGVAPQLIILKSRQNARSWTCSIPTASGISTTQRLLLNGTNEAVNQAYFPNQPTSTQFSIINDTDINANGESYIAYLFATLAGVSKVGFYTGNGSNQTINCGFTTGARFILIKRTDSTGDWYVWDTARGIVSGNDPHLSLNTTAAEVTSDDTIDPDSTGFIVNQVAATNVNVNAASYIFYAVS